MNQEKPFEYKTNEYYSEIVAADSCRKEYDIKNHSLLYLNTRPDFVFIGDSITQFWDLSLYFHFSKNLILNRGIAGDTTQYLNKRFDSDVIQLNPRYCILEIGTNDSLNLEGDYWKGIPPKEYNAVLNSAKSNYSEIISKAQNSDTQLILSTLLPISIPISPHETERKRYINELNQWISKMGEQYKLPVINYYTATVSPGTNRPLRNITVDGVHPNGNGYQIMSLLLKNTLSKNNIHI